MTTTLKVKGREKEFSKDGLEAILEQFYSKVSKKPMEGVWFKVDPRTIKWDLFVKEREDEKEEKVRLSILEVFERNDNRPFMTMAPIKTWNVRTVKELEELACILGDGMTDDDQQVLEWAQRISNGESWEEVCVYADTAKYPRLICKKVLDNEDYPECVKERMKEWKVVGGRKGHNNNAAATISDFNVNQETALTAVVPSVMKFIE